MLNDRTNAFDYRSEKTRTESNYGFRATLPKTRTESEFLETQNALTDTKYQLKKAQDENFETRSKLTRTESQLKTLQLSAEKTKEKLSKTESELSDSREDCKALLRILKQDKEMLRVKYAHSYLVGVNKDLLPMQFVMKAIEAIYAGDSVQGVESLILAAEDSLGVEIQNDWEEEFERLQAAEAEAHARVLALEVEHQAFVELVLPHFEIFSAGLHGEIIEEEQLEFEGIVQFWNTEGEERIEVERREIESRLETLSQMHSPNEDEEGHSTLDEFRQIVLFNYSAQLDILANEKISYSVADSVDVREQSFTQMNEKAVKLHRRILLERNVSLEDEIRRLKEMLAERSAVTSSAGDGPISELGEIE